MKPDLSIIITAYNLPEIYLAECLQSLNPLYPKAGIEVIIVDDGSTQPVDKVAHKHCPHAKVIRQPNGGLSAARNEGLRHAQGEYIQFLDGDDYLLPSYCKVIDTMQGTKPDIIMFTLKKATKKADISMSAAEYLLTHNLRASACGYVFRREILGDLRFTPRLLHEDEEFTPRLMTRADAVIDMSLHAYYYRRHPLSITTTATPSHLKRRYAHVLYIIRQLDVQPLIRRRRQLAADLLFNALRQRPALLPCIIRRLRQMGLYPLPWADYTKFYKTIAFLSRLT